MNDLSHATKSATVSATGDMVLTPSGFRPSSSVHLIPSSGPPQWPPINSAFTAAGAAAPTMPAAPGHTAKAPQVSAIQPFGSHAITFAYRNGPPELLAEWTVPPAPLKQSGQTIFLSIGMQTTADIVQAVLQWGPSAAGGGNHWSVASWYFTGGSTYHTSAVPVAVGASLYGAIQAAATTTTFNYKGWFQNIAGTSAKMPTVEYPTLWFAALEAYGITGRSDYPDIASTHFTQIGPGTSTVSEWTSIDVVTALGQHTSIESKPNSGAEIDIWYGPRLANFAKFAICQVGATPYLWAYRGADGAVAIEKILGGPAVEFSRTFSYQWDTNFSGFAGFDLNGAPYVWAYRAADGRVCIHSVNATGSGFTQKHTSQWDTGFSSFTAFKDSAGAAYVWAYRASTGTVCIHQIGPGGTGFTQKYFYLWDTGFSGFAAFTINNEPYVWAYRAGDGRVCIHKIAAQGAGFSQVHMSTWDSGFTNFAALVDAGVARIWAYRATTGTVCIHQISPGGTGFVQKLNQQWDTGFSEFTAFGLSISALQDVWAYRTTDGRICIHRINPPGTSFTQVYYGE
jgi:hypothetical protein